MSIKAIRGAARRVFEGHDPEEVANSLILEYRTPSATGVSLSGLASAALLIGSVWKLFKAAANTGDESLLGRAVNSLIGYAVLGGSDHIAQKIHGASITATGGHQAHSGKGVGINHNITFNVPSPNITKTISGSGASASKTITYPAMEQFQFAGITADPTLEGYDVNLWRMDPESGLTVGVPAKTYNISFKGTTPASLRKISDSISRSISSMAEALIHNKTIYRPPVMVQRRPGRPPMRSYRHPEGYRELPPEHRRYLP